MLLESKADPEWMVSHSETIVRCHLGEKSAMLRLAVTGTYEVIVGARGKIVPRMYTPVLAKHSNRTFVIDRLVDKRKSIAYLA
jgi:hypothetical protein